MKLHFQKQKKKLNKGKRPVRRKRKDDIETTVCSGWRTVPNNSLNPDVTFSVIIPAYNAEEYITEAMDSVINQTTGEQIELIIVDDCSTDNTFEVVNDYARRHPSTANRSIVILRNSKNAGVAFSRNQGVNYAGGEYVAFLDADDWWDPKKLELQYELLLKKSNEVFFEAEKAEYEGRKPLNNYPVLCCTARELADNKGVLFGKIIEVPESITYEMLLKTNSIPCSSVLIKRQVALEFPMKRDDLHEDFLVWLKVTKKYGPALGLNKPLLKSRMTPDGKSRNKIKSAKMQFKCYRYMHIGVIQSLWYLAHYAVAGYKKYN